MLCMFMFCLLTRTCTDCIYLMLGAGRSLGVFCVVLVKGMLWCMSVSKPSLPDLVRSFRNCEYPCNFGVADLGLSCNQTSFSQTSCGQTSCGQTSCSESS